MSTGSVDTSRPSIPRIPRHYRRVGSKSIYDPEILSIGPYHHDNSRLQNMKQVKYKYLERVLSNRNEQSMDRYVTAVAAMEKQARQCYANTINLDENKFVTLLVVDGIFIIEFLRRFSFPNLRDADDSIFSQGASLYLLHHDMLLLENQVPMFILSQLFNMTKTNNDGDHLIKLAIRFFGSFSDISFPDQSPFWDVDVKKIDHLCGLIHDGRRLPFVKTLSEPSNGSWEHILSASRLVEYGIKFKAANEDSFMDIKFVNGVLMIPVLEIHDSSESEFRNLIIYEQYLPGGRGIRRCFSDYAFFIFSLIKNSDDVDLLRSEGIILNLLGHDEEVCRMFNRLGKHAGLSDNFCYSQVFRSLNSHCGHRRNRWKANLRRNYFNSPWSIISFAAAAVLLILTIAQTIYTILGYYYR